MATDDCVIVIGCFLALVACGCQTSLPESGKETPCGAFDPSVRIVGAVRCDRLLTCGGPGIGGRLSLIGRIRSCFPRSLHCRSGLRAIRTRLLTLEQVWSWWIVVPRALVPGGGASMTATPALWRSGRAIAAGDAAWRGGGDCLSAYQARAASGGTTIPGLVRPSCSAALSAPACRSAIVWAARGLCAPLCSTQCPCRQRAEFLAALPSGNPCGDLCYGSSGQYSGCRLVPFCGDATPAGAH